MDTALVPRTGSLGRVARFVLHFFEMCVPMCVGFVVGDAVYLWAAGRLGYTDPFAELPVLSVVVVTVSMTLPMTAWMAFRGMPARAVREMTLVMPVLAALLLALGGLGIVPMGELALLEHGLMMPAMLIPMALHPGLYAHGAHGRAHGVEPAGVVRARTGG